ncbi:MAG TPA: FmdB family zinc ribbon protein [Candidatus Angelobacter sp.]
MRSLKLRVIGICLPLREYQCKKCKHRFERIQKFSDKVLRKCPECGGPLEQLLSAPAVQFKGTGWYVTDYAQKGRTKEGVSAEKGSTADKAASDQSDKKDDSKTGKEPAEAKAKKPEAKKHKD